MKTIEFEKIVQEAKAEFSEKPNLPDFNAIKLTETQQNGYKIIFDKISSGSGIKKFINKVGMKFTRNSLLQIIEMQNDINLELLKKIETLKNTVEQLETEVELLKKSE